MVVEKGVRRSQMTLAVPLAANVLANETATVAGVTKSIAGTGGVIGRMRVGGGGRRRDVAFRLIGKVERLIV